MQRNDSRAEHLGWIEAALRRQNPDLPRLRFIAQSHYGPPDHVAFVEVHGLDENRDRRRKIRADADAFFRQLGYHVGIMPGRDTYDIWPDRPTSVHEELCMIQSLRASCGGPGEEG